MAHVIEPLEREEPWWKEVNPHEEALNEIYAVILDFTKEAAANDPYGNKAYRTLGMVSRLVTNAIGGENEMMDAILEAARRGA